MLQNRPAARVPQEEQKTGECFVMVSFLLSRNCTAVTRGAHLRVALAQAVGVESGPVRAEVAAALRGRCVATHAIGFGMAGDAALEVLPSRLAVPGREEPLGIMVAGVER